MSAKDRIERNVPLVKISYLIAVKNKVRTIERCLTSLLDQNVDEIIVVDGKSTDGTSKIVNRFPVIHLMDTGTGLATARNIGLQRCTGDYIVVIDGDQWILQGFDRKLKALLQTNQVDVVFCKEVWVGSSIWAKAHQETWVKASTLRYDRLYRPRVLKRYFLHVVHGWDEAFTSFEDADMWSRMRRLHLNVCKSELIIYSDASDMSVLSEFNRGIWYGSRLIRFVEHHSSQWEELTTIPPIGFIIDLILSTMVLAKTRKIKIALAALLLRLARSVGWLVGVLLALEI